MDNLTSDEKRIINQYHNRKSTRPVKLECPDCGKEFETTIGKICSSYGNGIIVPFRCYECKLKKDEKFKDEVDEPTQSE